MILQKSKICKAMKNVNKNMNIKYRFHKEKIIKM